jgi:uncharacterized protein (DUF885 family)
MTKLAAACVSIGAFLLCACGDDGPYECVAPAPAPEVPVAELLAGLDGLPFEAFLEASYEAVLGRSPEGLAWRGLSARNDHLDDLSDAYALRTLDLLEAIQARLHAYERDALAPEQQISYDVYDWYLTDRLRRRGFLYYDYTSVANVHTRLYSGFIEQGRLASLADAEDYVARLQQVSRQVEDTRARLAARAGAGIIAPDLLLGYSAYGARFIADSAPRDLLFYTHLAGRLAALPDLQPRQRDALLGDAEAALACHMIPAFAALADDLERLLALAPRDHGAWQYEDGQAFYAAELAHHTSTGMTADEIHALGLSTLPALQAEIRARFAELGYPEDAPLLELYERLATDGGVLHGAQAVAELERLIAQAERRLGEAFVERPAAELVVIAVDAGNYYYGPSSDGSRPGAFYASVNHGMARYAMQTLVHHEAVPGHHLQVSLAEALDLPYVRRDLDATAYQEGWGLYAEELAAELGWLEGSPDSELGRLQAAALRAARLVVDTGIHAMGWSYDDALGFMIENLGMRYEDADYEVRRYIGWPGQATAYWIGKQRILDLRQQAADALGASFDLPGFHSAVLASGALPLDVLSRSIEAYIDRAGEAPGELPGPAPGEPAPAVAWLARAQRTHPARHGVAPARPARPWLDARERAWRPGACDPATPGCSPAPWLRGDGARARVP